MDAPSRFQTVSLVCKCGASLTHTDFAFRVGCAEEEFRAQHVGEFHVVSEADLAYSDECILCGKSDTASVLCAECQAREDRLRERIAKGALAALYRLKARLGKERARLARFYNEEVRKDRAAGRAVDCFNRHRDRCWYEVTICDMAMGMVDHEIRRTKKGED